MCPRVATGHFDGEIEWGYEWDTANNMMWACPKNTCFFVSIHGNLNKEEMMIKSDTEPWDLWYPIFRGTHSLWPKLLRSPNPKGDGQTWEMMRRMAAIHQ